MEEHDDQDIRKVRRIEKDDRNGDTGADSSEDVRGMEKIAGGRLGGDRTGERRDHTSLFVAWHRHRFVREAKCCRCSRCHRKVFLF